MTPIFILLVVGLALATATALVRGLFAFYRDGELLKEPSADRDLQRGAQQNRMMAQRVILQALTVFVIALLGVFVARA